MQIFVIGSDVLVSVELLSLRGAWGLWLMF